MTSLFFRNAHILDYANSIDIKGNLLIADGKIIALGEDITCPEDAEIITCDGQMLIPGLIDMQVFTGEPGEEHRETLATASNAAKKGGVTSMVVMPNTHPAIDDAALVDFILRRARDTAAVRVFPMAAITQNCTGDILTEFGLLSEAGAVAFTNADQCVMNALTMRRALAYAANFDTLLMHHALDPHLGFGVMHEGELATRMGLAGIPVAAETSIIDRDIRLVELTGARYHVAQISAAESVAAIAAAKARGLPISCSVSVNHLMLNETDVMNYRSFAKLSPPLRSEADRKALVQGVADGTIDAVVSAHNPQDAEAKRQPFAQAAYGSVGLEMLLPSLISLHHSENISLSHLLAAVTCNPAKLLGLAGGSLKPGYAADLCLINSESPWQVNAAMLSSKSKNAAMDGRYLQGYVQATYVDGICVYEREKTL